MLPEPVSEPEPETLHLMRSSSRGSEPDTLYLMRASRGLLPEPEPYSESDFEVVNDTTVCIEKPVFRSHKSEVRNTPWFITTVILKKMHHGTVILRLYCVTAGRMCYY